MILAIDMGNSHISIGCLEGDRTVFVEQISTDKSKTALEYAVNFKTVLELYNISLLDIEGAILSSVVPPLTQELVKGVEKTIGKTPLVVGPGIKTGLNIKMDDPKSIGSDLIVGAVSAINYYGGPLILIDLGTANTISVVDKSNCYIGGSISPGVRLSMEALAAKADQLYRVSMDTPVKAIGKNTIDSLNSGLLLGAACTIDGMIDRVEEELGYKAKCVATGSFATKVIPLCRHEIIINEKLVMHGLKVIYDKNRV